MTKSLHLNRRQFLSSAAAFTIVPRFVLGGPGHTPPSEKLNIAGIGVGGMGHVNISNMDSENIVALCDVDLDYAKKSFQKFPDAKIYSDFRVMLETQKNIDAVMIATPDHTHAVITQAALQAGKHVYCQKPLAHDIHETRQMTLAAKNANVVTQMGIQFHSIDGTRRVCEWVQAGLIGPVREVDAWCSFQYRPYGHEYWSTFLGDRPTETPPTPDTLNWPLWIGPAPTRPYHPTYHPQKWRAWWDFGTGMMCDRGVHTLDSVFWALKLNAPDTIELIRKEGDNNEIHPDIAVVRYSFPARGEMPPVVINWYSGMEPPRPEELEPDRRMGDSEGGVIIKGDKGKIMHGTWAESPRIIPEEKMKAAALPPQSIPRIDTTHEQNWIHCCKTGQTPSSSFNYGGPLTEFALLGNLAIRIGGKFQWDPNTLKALNRPDADEWIKRPYHNGWSL